MDKMNFKNRASLSPAWFSKIVSGWTWKYAKHLKILNGLLMDLSSRKIRRLIVNMPPRHGKSELISKNFPAWYLCTHPDERIILTTYGSQFASSWGRKIKDIIAEFGEDLFNISLNPKTRSMHNFNIADSNGGIDCVGAGGALTGKGANLLIIDDPVKNSVEAMSTKIRDNMWDWLVTTALTRLEPDGAVAMIMTRWHDDDLCGRLISKNKIIDFKDYLDSKDNLKHDMWVRLSLPALAEEDDCLGRKAGKPLWEERFNRDYFIEQSDLMGNIWFNAMYQQVPINLATAIFNKDKFRYFESDDEFYFLGVRGETEYKVISKKNCEINVTADLAISTKETSDWTVFIVFAVTREHDIMILDVWRGRFDPVNHLNILLEINNKYRPNVIGIESVQYQGILIAEALSKGLNAKKLEAREDKVSRSLGIAARMDGGKIFFRKDAHWLDKFEDELIRFPNGRNDDQVDAFSYIAKMIQPGGSIMPVGIGRTFKNSLNL